jgi:hypothetical protein
VVPLLFEAAAGRQRAERERERESVILPFPVFNRTRPLQYRYVDSPSIRFVVKI